MQNICLQTYRNNSIRLRVAYVLRKIQTFRVLKIQTREFLEIRM